MLNERDARRALAWLVEAADPRVENLVASSGVVEAVELLSRSSTKNTWTRRLASFDHEQAKQAEAAAQARFIIPGDDDWPASLCDLRECPVVQNLSGEPLGLWVRGRGHLAELGQNAVALVGSRAATAYGERTAAEIAAELADQGATIVSGGAYGIDAAAHRGTLAAGGATVAFLAGGLSEFYPKGNVALLTQVMESGLVISEYPPDENPTRVRFLARNRLIAALAKATVIVEGSFRSGARNTVTWATALGRPVGAVPGPVTHSTTATPHRLIREAEAVLVTSATDVLELVRPVGEVEARRPACERLLDTLTPAQKAVQEALPRRGSRSAGEIALRSGLGMPKTLAALDELAEWGLARPHTDGGWGLGDVRNRPRLSIDARASPAH